MQTKANYNGSTRLLIVASIAIVAVAVATFIACRKPAITEDPAGKPTTSTTQPLSEADIALCNQGVAEMGKFNYAGALEQFNKFLAAQPDSREVKVNLAIAMLNRQLEGDEAKAEKQLEEVVEQQPDHLRANYCLGLIKLHGSAPTEALAHFRKVADADPADAYAAYYTALCLFDALKFDEALEWYNRATERDPYLRSAYYGRFQTLQRLSKQAEAKAELDRFQRLSRNPQARLAEFKYSRMGPKASVVAIDLPGDAKVVEPQTLGAPFGEAEEISVELPEGLRWAPIEPERRPNVTACDIDNNGMIDLFITRSLERDGKVINALLLQDERGFQLAADHPLAAVADVNAALWGDLDNDGLNDVYLCRQGGNQLWRQAKPGEWQDDTESTMTSGGKLDTVDGALFDADHDGDLDIYTVNADGPNELFSNNLNGTFRAIAAQQGIAGDGRPSRQVLVADLDNDRDVDIVVVHAEAPHEVFINDLLWNYHPATNAEALLKAEIRALVAVDSNSDGALELISASESKISKWQLTDKESPVWTAVTDGEWTGELAVKPALTVADPYGSGAFLVLADHGAVTAAIDPRATSKLTSSEIAKSPMSAVINLQVGQGPAIVSVQSQVPPRIARSKVDAKRFAWLKLTGKDEEGESMRTNRSGIGAQVAARVGSRWTVTSTYRNDSGPGQSLTPLAIGTGGAPVIDFVEINWSDGVLQTEPLVQAGKLHTIVETQRQQSSCPVLFAWNGHEYAFVTDLLGVGGMGFAMGPGVYAPVRPWENVLLPEGLLQPKQGRFELKLTEPMEEACYLDSLRLVAYDLPAGWQMTLDERLATASPEATGEPRYYRKLASPAYAENDRGQDVTAKLLAADLRPVLPTERDTRFIGRCAEHWVTLRFAEPLDAAPGEPLLVADGWTEYPYSQTMFAAWQADASYDPPTVEARAPGGEWTTVLERFGYPAGMSRQMSAPLGKLPAGTTELRIRTNQEIYWDRLTVVWAEECPEVRRIELPLASAKLNECGFPMRLTTPHYARLFDFSKRLPFGDARHLAGFYTAVGPCEELVTATDDAVAIFGPGEQVEASFIAPAEPPKTGATRRFVLETAGWCKDMDLYTQTPDTLEPLPRRGSSKPTPEREVLHKRFQTRFRTGE